LSIEPEVDRLGGSDGKALLETRRRPAMPSFILSYRSSKDYDPTVGQGGGVEFGVLAALPAEHPAEQIRSRLSRPYCR
jgi:hypothetical protein